MNVETQKRLTPLFDKVMGVFCDLSGTETYEEAIAWLQAQFQNKSTSPAPWLHKMAREIYPTEPFDMVNPENFYEILSMIDTREKTDTVFVNLPEEAAPQIESFLTFLLRDLFPSMRSNADLMRKNLPQRRVGGRPPTIPGEEKRRAICNEIAKLERMGVKRGEAQLRLVAKTGIKLRTIQRIWRDRNKY